MKYLKLFEELSYQYKIGDYVKLKGIMTEISSGEPSTFGDWNVWICAKIIALGSNTSEEDREEREPDYFIETFQLWTKEIELFWADESEIERKCTQDEIDEYEARLSAIKYNL